MSISPKVEARITSQLKQYRSILAAAKQRDVSESDLPLRFSSMGS